LKFLHSTKKEKIEEDRYKKFSYKKSRSHKWSNKYFFYFRFKFILKWNSWKGRILLSSGSIVVKPTVFWSFGNISAAATSLSIEISYSPTATSRTKTNIRKNSILKLFSELLFAIVQNAFEVNVNSINPCVCIEVLAINLYSRTSL